MPLGGQGKLYGIVAVPESCPRGIYVIDCSCDEQKFYLSFLYQFNPHARWEMVAVMPTSYVYLADRMGERAYKREPTWDKHFLSTHPSPMKNFESLNKPIHNLH